MAPKTIARISRFHLAVARLHRLEWRDPSPYDEGMPYLDCASAATDHKTARPTIPWADWALDCGYYDQSHFINEFRTSSGMSPLEFLQRTRHG
jgi:AraC-like DNA-binding protein